MQLVRGSSATIRYRFLDGETPVALESASITATDDLGNTVATATATEATTEPDGTWQADLTAEDLDEVGQLTVTWDGITAASVHVVRTQTVEVVGGFYFDLAELRAMPDISDDTETYTTDKLTRARKWAETRIESVCGTSFVERFRTETRSRRSVQRGRLQLSDAWPRRLLSLTADGTAYTTDDLAALAIHQDPGYVACVTRGDPYAIRYVAGYATEPPEDLRMAAITVARNRLLAVDGHSGIPDRARTVSSDAGTYGLQMADSGDHPTGYFDEDAIIVSYRNRVNTLVA